MKLLKPFPLTRAFVGFVSQESQRILATMGLATETLGAAARFVMRGRVHVNDTLAQSARAGWQTLPLVLLMNSITGMIIGLNIAPTMVERGGEAFVGNVVALAMLRELGPVLTGFSVIALIGSAYGAELATANMTNQVDALSVFRISPIRYFVLPRLLATMGMLPVLTVIGATAGIIGGALGSNWFAGVSYVHFFDAVRQQIDMTDLATCVAKGTVFGVLLAVLACTIGIHTRGGAKEVGQATTRAVVWAFLAMAIADYLITYMVYAK